MSVKVEALRLYRHCLKSLSLLPETHATVFRRKLHYNYREIFEIHKNETSEAALQSLLADGWRDLETMKELFKLDPAIIQRLFPIFDMSPSPTTTPPSPQSSTPLTIKRDAEMEEA